MSWLQISNSLHTSKALYTVAYILLLSALVCYACPMLTEVAVLADSASQVRTAQPPLSRAIRNPITGQHSTTAFEQSHP